MSKGILVVASGFSGAGKGTIMKKLISEYGSEYALSISATTRAPRPGEEHGREYFFTTTEEFEAMIERNELVEYAKYVNNYYGTPKAYVEEQLSAGKNVVLEIEIQGALKVKEKFPDAVLMFITAPSAKELKNRLVGRGTESKDVIDARLSRAYEESLGVEEYDYLVVNDDIDSCVSLVDDIISKEREKNTVENKSHRVSANIEFINNIRKELLSFSKGV